MGAASKKQGILARARAAHPLLKGATDKELMSMKFLNRSLFLMIPLAAVALVACGPTSRKQKSQLASYQYSACGYVYSLAADRAAIFDGTDTIELLPANASINSTILSAAAKGSSACAYSNDMYQLGADVSMLTERLDIQ